MLFYIDIVLTNDQREALAEKNLTFSEMSFGIAAYHRTGITFPEDECDGVLSILGLMRAEDNGSSELETPQGKYIEDYEELDLFEMPTPLEPLVWVRPRMRSEHDEFAFKEFQAESGLGLVLRYFEQNFTEHHHRPGTLFVNLHSSPTREFEVDRSINGLGGGYVLAPRRPGKKYVPITCKGRKVAYFQGDSSGGSLWLLFETHYYERALLDYVLYAVLRLMRPELGKAVSYEEYEAIYAREQYIKRAGHLVRREADSIDLRLEQADVKVEEARRDLVGAMRQLNAVKCRGEELQHSNNGEVLRAMKERLAKEFDDLESSPEFESIKFEGEKVLAETRPIKLRHNGRIYEMGKYEIIVGTERIRIRSIDGEGHPHLEGERACFGNSRESISKLQADMSYGVLLPFLVNYLEYGYNPADSYSNIENYRVKSYDESEEAKHAPSKPRRKRAKAKKAKATKASSSKTRSKRAKAKPAAKKSGRKKAKEVKK
jgi:hypothetical protein